MPSAIAVRCPNCGATLSAEKSDESATCAYCGTRSVIVRAGAPRPPTGSVIVVRSGSPVASVVAGVIVVGAAVAIVGYTRGTERWLTSFALADGARRWHVSIAPGLQGATRTGAGLLLHGGGRLTLVDPRSGAALWSVGR